MKEYLVYLAGPIKGLSYDEAQGWRDDVCKALPENITGISPLRGREYLRSKMVITGAYDEIVTEKARTFIGRDYWDVRRSDIVLVNLLQSQSVSIGTMMEVGYAASLQKPVVLIMEDDNVHQHPFLIESALYVVDNLEYAIELMSTLFG